MNQQSIINNLPSHLQPFAALQHYQRYNARDHAVWRFLLHQLRQNLAQTAHAVYIDGLTRTGISLEAIPRIEDINSCLEKLGWHAVVVDGFLPPAIFMEFQAHRVLPIAVDMRSIDHMLYTPAPDIVHESAGHLPFIVDVDYAEFLQRFGELGMHAIANKDDIAVYEAVRHLSIVKEAVNSSEQIITEAEQALEAAIAANHEVSEAALLARLHWWTVEYGLVGEVDDYKIFGAGLLSSLGESVSCLSNTKVNKLPLTVDAIATTYDITHQQPQLFVTKNCRHLTQVLEEFGRQMCVNRGGPASLQQAVKAQTVNTAVSNSGLAISGCFNHIITDVVGNVTYIKTTGATQLSYKHKQLPGHGIDYHAQGFGSPLGRLQSLERCLSSYTIDELKQQGIAEGLHVTLNFLSGICVVGELTHIVRREQKNILMRFEQCTVTALNGDVLFDPSWGVYDMAVADAIDAVFGGTADPQHYALYAAPSEQSTQLPSYDDKTRHVFSLYQQVRDLRESLLVDADNQTTKAAALKLSKQIIQQASDEWLLLFEAIELIDSLNKSDDLLLLRESLATTLAIEGECANEEKRCVINYAISRLSVS
ncbi:MAG: aromatic amino acid hydroxylase [Cellvibrionales bacterium]|nr:aromatic amino acid hydroxylase [Cellvibrionales bacterium]